MKCSNVTIGSVWTIIFDVYSYDCMLIASIWKACPAEQRRSRLSLRSSRRSSFDRSPRPAGREESGGPTSDSDPIAQNNSKHDYEMFIDFYSGL